MTDEALDGRARIAATATAAGPLGKADQMTIEYSVVIPVYRAAESLAELHERLTKALDGFGGDYEIILVDDASPDDSWRVMQELRRGDPRVKLIQHMRNFGQHKAVLCGLEHASGEYVVTMDDDLQHPPEEVPKLVEAVRGDDGVDVVIGAYEVKQHSWFRNLGTKVLDRISAYVFRTDRRLKLTSFRVLRSSVVREVIKDRRQCPRVGHLVLAVTNRIRNVPVRHDPREHGRSGYSFRRLVSDALDNILSNSSLPLQVVSFLGFGSSAASLILAVYYICRYLFGAIGVPGWTTTTLLLLFFSGAVLFSLGIVGEYLIRILREVQKSSRSIIRKKEGL